MLSQMDVADAARAEAQRVKAALKAGDPMAVLDAARARHQAACDQVLAASGAAIACRRGCAHCCHSFVILAGAHEIVRIADHVQATWSKPKRAQLIERLEANRARLAGLGSRQRRTTNLDCPFVEDDACSIHAVRPASCRDHHAQAVEGCIHVLEHPEDLTFKASFVMPLRFAALQLSSAIAAGFRQAGYDGDDYELNSGVLEALQDATAIRRFRKQKTTFLQALRP